ncbi:histidinol phosphatase, partial [Streptomyces sp. NPDC005534]
AVDAGVLFSLDTDAHAPGQLDWQIYGCARAEAPFNPSSTNQLVLLVLRTARWPVTAPPSAASPVTRPASALA